MVRKGCLFGGALFAAGFVGGESVAQEFTIQSHRAAAVAVDSGGGTDFSTSVDFGFFGPLDAFSGAVTSYAYGLVNQIGGWSEASVGSYGYAYVNADFRVSEDVTVSLDWDWDGSDPSVPYAAYWVLDDLTTNFRIDFAIQTVHPDSGSREYQLVAGHDYRFFTRNETSLNGFSRGVLSIPESVLPCDLDANLALNIDDIDAFVMAFLSGDLSVDFDGNGALNLDDVDAFVACFLGG